MMELGQSICSKYFLTEIKKFKRSKRLRNTDQKNKRKIILKVLEEFFW